MIRSYLFFTLLICAQIAPAQENKQITIDDIWKNGTFKVKDVPGFNAMSDGLHYTQLDKDGAHIRISIYNLASGKEEHTLFDNITHKYDGNQVKVESYTFSADEKKMLLFSEDENIYRRSILHRVYIYDIAAGTLKLLDHEKVLHATFSPDGTKVAYVKNNDLYYRDIQNETTVRVTKDGEKNRIINGNCDWVYEEEFSFTRAFEWSKNSRFLAWYHFDESLVPQYTMARYNGLYPEQYTYKYPKAGERSSIVQINIHDLREQKTVGADIGAETDQYIPRIRWTNDTGKLCIYRMNRLQNKLELLLTNAITGQSSVVYTDTDTSYINVDDEITFLPDTHSMIIRSERNGYNHLYSWDWHTARLTDLTPGNYDVDALVGVDVPRKLVYYTSAEASPLQRKLYVSGWNGKNKKCLTPDDGMHIITPCAGFNYFLDKHSRLDRVPVYTLLDARGNPVRVLEDNKALENKMKEYALGRIRFMKVQGADESLNAWAITPPDFDSTKRYPVLMFQYSGPGSQKVADLFPISDFFWHQMLAQKGYIIVCADGTGTGFRGSAFRKKTYLQLGRYETDDQVAVAQNLSRLPYVDKDRIGIWGWSYGGFMSANCILKGNDVFKLAIAVAPVTNWRYYDNIYTERYMRTPHENPKGYDDNAPEKIAGRLKGKLLIIHGTADDNVHFQNSVMFTDALIKAGRQFESEYYPDKAHSISGGLTRHHLYTRMTDFILKNL